VDWAVREWGEGAMKDGNRFVDCDMHIMEPMDLFDKYLDLAFKPRITPSVGRQDGGLTGMRGRPLWFFDGTPTRDDGNTSRYNRIRGPLVSKRVMPNPSITKEIAGKILSGGVRLYGFGDVDFAKADAAMQRRDNLRGVAAQAAAK
jgi:hypothetical protein